MVSVEQVMRLKCCNCSWESETDAFGAKDLVAEHTHYWTEEKGYPYYNHVVEGTAVTVFREEL